MPSGHEGLLPSLSEQLKALGVKTGARGLTAPPPRNPYSIESVVGGGPWQTPLGETFAVEARSPAGQPHGQAALEITSPLGVLAEWAGAPHLADLPPEAFAFLDTETTGLSGPEGTYAFLIGVGRFVSGERSERAPGERSERTPGEHSVWHFCGEGSGCVAPTDVRYRDANRENNPQGKQL